MGHHVWLEISVVISSDTRLTDELGKHSFKLVSNACGTRYF